MFGVVDLRGYKFRCVGYVTQLPQQVEQDEEVGEETSTVPGGLDVLALLPPLKPHADPVLQEGADQAEPGHMGEVVLGDPQKLREEEGSD